VKKKSTAIGKIAGKAAPLVLATALGLVGCGALPDNEGIENIQFDKIDTKWKQTEVNSKIKLAMSQLSAQSRAIKDQYIDVESGLRSELNSKGDNFDLLAQIAFAKNIQNIQYQVAAAYNGQRPQTQDGKKGPQTPYTFNEMMTDVSGYMNDLAAAISALINNTDKAALFNAQVTAFQMAHYVDQRKWYSSKAEETEVLTAFSKAVAKTEQLGGGQNLSVDSPFVTATMLKQQILTSMPTTSGENRRIFIQQFEDFAQFDGWTDDLTALSYDLSVSP